MLTINDCQFEIHNSCKTNVHSGISETFKYRIKLLVNLDYNSRPLTVVKFELKVGLRTQDLHFPAKTSKIYLTSTLQ